MWQIWQVIPVGGCFIMEADDCIAASHYLRPLIGQTRYQIRIHFNRKNDALAKRKHTTPLTLKRIK